MDDASMRVVQVAAPVREQLLHNLRQAIMDRRFRPGQRLVERELIEMTGVSRTSVREALRQLEAEGVVKTVPHKGTFVAVPTREEAEELFDVRASLEAIAARRFAETASDDEVKELRSLLDQMSDMSEVGEILTVKDDFYRLLGSRAPLVYSMLSSLHLRITMLRGASLSRENRLDTSRSELDDLVAAIERRDHVAAAEAAAHHVRQAAKACFETLET